MRFTSDAQELTQESLYLEKKMADRPTPLPGPPPGRSFPWMPTLAGPATVIVVVAALVNVRSSPAVLAADVVLAAACGAAVMLMGGGRWQGRAPWVAAGALFGAVPLSDLGMAPWLLAAALAFAFAGVVGRHTVRPSPRGRLGIFVLSAAVNTALLWPILLGGHRPVPSEVFVAKELRSHELLEGVPIHDVWTARLVGGPRGLTMLDTRDLLVDGFRRNRNTTFLVTAGIRGVLSSLLGWDEDRCNDPAASYVHRLGEADRGESEEEPGESLFLYTSEDEALLEIMNCTVHAFIAMALEPEPDGYRIYWAFYVRPVGRITANYMGLIQPFRVSFIYPTIIEGVERRWVDRWSRGDP